MVQIQVTVDGTVYEDDVEPRLLFVHYLRDQLGLTGTNIGCDTSNCGSCTVLLDGHSAKSCTVLAVQADGSEVTTIQGLAEAGFADAGTEQAMADGERAGREPVERVPARTGANGDGWHPLQRAFHQEHGLQCGYCTPGMIMASVDLLQDNPDPTDDEVRAGLEGNLCRCTGYENIVRAVLRAASELRGGQKAGAPDTGASGGGQ